MIAEELKIKALEDIMEDRILVWWMHDRYKDTLGCMYIYQIKGHWKEKVEGFQREDKIQRQLT